MQHILPSALLQTLSHDAETLPQKTGTRVSFVLVKQFYLADAAGFLPHGLQHLTSLLHSKSPLIPEGSQWLLVLALYLLQQLLLPQSNFAAYLHVLPTPLGSVRPSVCPSGPPSANVLYFK